MPAAPVNAILRVKMFFGVTTRTDRCLNVLHYRNTAVAAEDPNLFDFIKDTFLDAVAVPMLANMEITTSLRQLRFSIIKPTESFEAVYDYGPTEKLGTITGLGSENFQGMAACFIRRSYLPGRRGVGKTFFGPLASCFTDGDFLNINPAVAGNLDEVQEAFEAEVATADAGVWKPNIYGALEDGESYPLRDQRTTGWSPLISYLDSRRPGRGS